MPRDTRLSGLGTIFSMPVAMAVTGYAASAGVDGKIPAVLAGLFVATIMNSQLNPDGDDSKKNSIIYGCLRGALLGNRATNYLMSDTASEQAVSVREVRRAEL